MKNHNKGTSVFKNIFMASWLMLVSLASVGAQAATSITALATPSTATAPASVTLSITVNADPDPVTVTQVEYFNGITPLGVAGAAPFSLELSQLPAGSYSIVAKATITNLENPVLVSEATPLIIGSASAAGQSVYYIQTDQLNTPRAITDQGSTIVWTWESDSYGSLPPTEKPATAPAFNFNQRFPGQYYDKETNLHYNYYRDYDSQTGRYVQSDPIGLRGGINTYGYAGANPLSNVDPDGRLFFLLLAGPSVAAAAGDLAIVGGLVWATNNAKKGPMASSSDPGLQVAIESKANYREYKRYCDEPPPPGGNPCDDAQNELRNARMCKAAREENTKKWWGGVDNEHSPQMVRDLDNRIANAERAVRNKCPAICK